MSATLNQPLLDVRAAAGLLNVSTRTVYTLETMPWMYPDSADSYLALLRAIDRPGAFGVHLDPVNLVNSPERFFRNADLLRDCFAKLPAQPFFP